MPGTGANKVLGAVIGMVQRAKQYGKKKQHDLAAVFARLSLSPAKIADQRPPLAPIAANAAPSSTRAAGKQPRKAAKNKVGHSPDTRQELPQPLEKPEVVHEYRDAQLPQPVYNPANEITSLTSLQCVNAEIKDFHQFWQFIETYFVVKKVAQGSYASVLRMAMITSSALYTVWKVMPLKPKKGRGSRRPDQTLIEDAAAEVKALACMQEIDGFVDFRSAQVVRGSLPEKLNNINSEWAQTHPDDSNDVVYPEDQLWLLIEMSDAGTDLETVLTKGFPDGSLLHKTGKRERVSFSQVWDIFWSAAEALANGEAQADFEHRDLHPGNICINQLAPPIHRSEQQEVERYTNLQVTLIDYTLSRARVDEGEVLVNSMKDRTLFDQHSDDPIDERQYETYRHMRDLIMYGPRGVRENSGRWKDYVPATNVTWLFHVLWLLLLQTEHYPGIPRLKKELNSFDQIEDETERGLAQRLEAVTIHLRPMGDEDDWRYLSATEVVDDQMGELERPFQLILEEDSQAMKQLRMERAARLDNL